VRLLRDLMSSMKGKLATQLARMGHSTGKTETQKHVVQYWTTPTFVRWRSNPNWPGRRAAAALRTAGKTRRMR
jgi:hypothetical protein